MKTRKKECVFISEAIAENKRKEKQLKEMKRVITQRLALNKKWAKNHLVIL